jgi:hypothetical protein
VAQRASRKRRRKGCGGASAEATAHVDAGTAAADASVDAAAPVDAFERRYARSRAKDEAARAALKPLVPGERPTAVTVGAVVAALLAAANAISLAFGYNTDEVQLALGTVLMTLILVLVAWGMWHAKYWAVLGLQTLLGLTLVVASLALLTAANVWATVLMLIIIAGAGTLFWFLVKAMARIQMPPRPGSSA